MNDWYQCTKEEQTLIASAKPNEVCILFGQHGVKKLTRDVWASVYRNGWIKAAQLAAAKVGARITLTDDRIDINAELIDEDWNLEASTLTVRLRGSDGREVAGVAHLQPPSVH